MLQKGHRDLRYFPANRASTGTQGQRDFALSAHARVVGGDRLRGCLQEGAGVNPCWARILHHVQKADTAMRQTASQRSLKVKMGRFGFKCGKRSCYRCLTPEKAHMDIFKRMVQKCQLLSPRDNPLG